MDESLSSVEQFLRDNGLSISDPGALGSLSGDELLDDELLLSDAEERPPARGSSDSDSPRFVLLEDADLLLDQEQQEQQHQNQEQDADQRLSGDRTSEQQHETSRSWANAQDTPTQQDQDSLDRSMLFGTAGSVEPLEQSAASSFMLEMQHETEGNATPELASPFASVYQMTLQQKEKDESGDHAAMVSAASSASLPPSLPEAGSAASSRVLDDELNDALGVPRSSRGERRSTSSRRSSGGQSSSGSGGDRRSQLSTQRALFTEEERSIEGGGRGGSAASSARGSGDDKSKWSQPRSGGADRISTEEKKEENADESVGSAAESLRSQERGVDAGVGEGDWIGLNDLLRRNGLPAVGFRRVGSGEVLPDRDSLFSVIHDFGVQLERKNQTIQDLVLASKRHSRVRSRAESERQTSEKKTEETQNALDKAKAEIQRLKALQKKESESAELLSKKLRNSCLQLKQQLKVSEHRVKAKEVVVERMQAKLQQQVDKEDLSKTRDRRAFRNLQDRDPRRSNPRDIQALEAIGAYEAQREQMQEEMEHLKSQVAALNSELRDKENFIARQGGAALKAEPPVWDEGSDEGGGGRRLRHSSSVASDEVMLEQLEAARREQEVAAAKLRHREAVMVKKVAMIEQELLAAREAIGELREENANLTLEAESRPSIRDYRLSQRRIHQLERQVTENKLALEEASDLNELRKYMGTKELVERDRLNHRLHLNRLNALPRETTLEVVKHVCRALHLTDITLIAPSLDKLCSVVAAVPRMEKFIRDVCGFVFLHLHEDADAEDADGARFELEQVLPTLQQWVVERRKLHALEGFKTAIVTELCKRTVEPAVLNDAEAAADEGPRSQPTTLSRAVHIVSELVELEKSVMHHREIYTQAAAEVERRPNVLINQIVRHFSHLFQVKSIEGVLPKINETYLFVNEMKNFLNVVRDLLGLRKDTSLVHCLDAIKEQLQADADPARRRHSENAEGAGVQQENTYSDNRPNFVVEKRQQPSARGGSADANLVGVRQVREMSVLVRELKRELGAATMAEILPRTKRLMELLSLSVHNADPDDDEEYE